MNLSVDMRDLAMNYVGKSVGIVLELLGLLEH